MENKKTFGAFVLRRRKELGMTQKEFAGKLYVTESAVSKWERGMSYPDITLIRSICDVLEVSEHELLTGSEDTEKRTSEKLAEKYLRLTRNYRLAQYLLYGAILLGCAIGNLASSHTLDWFFIVLTAVMMSASLTLVPALAALHPALAQCKAAVSLGSFLVSLELLLLVCCLQTGGDWFPMAGVSVLFGFALVLLPFLLPTLPLPEWLTHRKTSFYLIIVMALLILLLLTGCVTSGGDWFFTAAVGTLFGTGFLILPVLLRQLPLPETLRPHKTLLYFAIQTAFLFLLLLIVALEEGGGEDGLRVSLPTAALLAALPWGEMLLIRYLPANGWFKASACAAFAALWVWLFPAGLDAIMTLEYGPAINSWELWLPYDFSKWGGNQTAINVFAIILFTLLAIAAALAGVGIWRKKKGR